MVAPNDGLRNELQDILVSARRIAEMHNICPWCLGAREVPIIERMNGNQYYQRNGKTVCPDCGGTGEMNR